MGILDVILGRDAQGSPSKINMALIALLLWRWYQSQQGGAQPAPVPKTGTSSRGGGTPTPRVPRQQEAEAPTPAEIPQTQRGSGNDFDDLRDSVRRVPRDGGNGRGMETEGGMGGGLGDILGDILGGGAGRSGRGGQAGPGGGGLGDILGDVLGGGAGRGGRGGQMGPGGGGLGDILGDILGGGRGSPGARVSSQQGDPLGGLGGLGGLLAGGAGGGVLGDILSQFEQAGKGDAAKSWVAQGQNIPVTPRDIENTFGPGIINDLAAQFDMPRDELLRGLSEVMPEAVDALTPDGRLPTADEISRRV
jgi:uncharacterized protein YidB (DUF937 family)